MKSLGNILNLCFWWLWMRSRGKVNTAKATIETSQPVTIHLRALTSAGFEEWGKKEQVYLARFQLGESLLVSQSVHSGSHSLTGLLILFVSVVWGVGGGWGEPRRLCTNLACNVARITALEPEPRKKVGENGKIWWSIFICELCTDIPQFLKTLASSSFFRTSRLFV